MKRNTITIFILVSSFYYILLGCAKEYTERSPNQVALYPETNSAGGCPGTTYDDWETSDFVLPYPVGESYSIDLSHCSGSYHTSGTPDQYAIDFAMSIGSVVTAARDGKIVHIEDSGYDFSHPNNLVVVEHSDGTYGQYMHLTRHGARGRVGQNVIKGQVIGLSGATGLAGYPHLHFIVTKSGNWKYPYVSVPRNFRNTSANKFSLQMGQSYKALPYEQ